MKKKLAFDSAKIGHKISHIYWSKGGFVAFENGEYFDENSKILEDFEEWEQFQKTCYDEGWIIVL